MTGLAPSTTGATLVAGVAGSPVRHSLSPMIHSAWIAAAGLDAVYIPVPVAKDGFARLVEGLRGGAMRGLNVTVPFKEEALAVADGADAAAARAGAANLLLFGEDGRIQARNTDGLGLIAAFAEQAPGFAIAAAPIVVLGAGGAARGAITALLDAGAPEVRIVNRTEARARELARGLTGAAVFGWQEITSAFAGASALVNATAAGLSGEGDLSDLPLNALPEAAVVMDMVYKPLRTGLLRAAAASGRPTVDGLSMLINQARPSFEAFYGVSVPPGVDVRGSCLAALGEKP